ncbi:MAG: ATP-dependent DNA helicase RecG [Ornithinimicrobium sp.]
MTPVTLDTPLRTVIGTSAGALDKGRSLRTVGDLLDFFPRRYLDPARPTDFSTITEGDEVVLVATVASATTRAMKSRRGTMLNATVVDEAGHELGLTFFRPFGHERALLPGVRIICSGTVSSFRHAPQLTHPEYQVLTTPSGLGPATGGSAGATESTSGVANALAHGLIPVYPTVPKCSPITLRAAMDLVLHATDRVPDPIPEAVRRARHLPDLLTAYRQVHQPQREKDARLGRWRMKFQEAFVIQAALAGRRHAGDAVPATPRPTREGGLAQAFTDNLPFTLTQGQEDVLGDLRQDLDRALPMHRLLQGEVGSGKTIVALLGMLTVIDAGGQAALLAPTEVLAQQHHRSISALLGPLAHGGMLSAAHAATRVAILTGSQSAAQRRANLLLAASGEAGIVVGTHALIQEHVQFAELGLVVVDEQHRFGVRQRDALRAKATNAPHVLVMTATPIPRTVAMTVFGDMEISTLRELPRGRQPISTHVVTGDKPGWVQRMWKRVAEEAAQGHQVYVVCPRIGSEDEADLATQSGCVDGQGGCVDGQGGFAGASPAQDRYPGPGVPIPPPAGEDGPVLHGVIQVHRALLAVADTASLRIGVLHGKMPADDKDAVMTSFSTGDLDVLVATTVIEVGVDVPQATVMVVLDADRFGISQLHQLRGRIGRGDKPGLCLLVTQGVQGPAQERLEAVAATTDGFELSRVDLENRREGDVLGATQSGGRSGLRFLQLTRDEDLIVAAHEDAWACVAHDPDLVSHPDLRVAIDRLDAERAAFLERG